MSKAIDITNYRRRRKANLMRVLGNECCICHYNLIQDALEFHHINPDEKSYGIASGGVCRDLETDLVEIKKCVLVCANCHRAIHKNLYSQEQLKEMQYYNEDVANELRQEKQNLLSKTVYYCSSCGKELKDKTKTGLCADCYLKSNRKADRPNRETLKELIRTKSFTEIGTMYGVSDNAIRKWCDAENLPRKKTDINKFTDVQWAEV